MARTTFYQKNYIGWPPVHVSQIKDPDSAHWQGMALAESRRLCQAMGKDAYIAWLDSVPEQDNALRWFRLFEAKGRELEESGSGS